MGIFARSTPARWVDREDELHERAIDLMGGVSDFGDQSYREPLRILLEAYDHEARFHMMGRMLAGYQLTNMLANRLRAEQWWKLRPSALDVRIERPIFITGMVRTGSTALHYLMGANPEMQCLQYWLANHPQPRPPRHTWEDARDFQRSLAELDMVYKADPGLAAIHYMFAEGPEECRHFLSQSFTDDCYEVGNSVPSYAKWYKTRRHVESYRRHKKLVQLVGSYEPEKRWLLKYPVHLRHIDALLEVYPDACIVWTHRDPGAVLPSYVSLCTNFRKLQEEAADPRQVAKEQLEVWSEAVHKGLAARKGREHQFFDVHFKDFMRDPLATVRAIYEHFDVPMTERALAGLRSWREKNPPERYGKHSYDSEDLGISQGEIRERFGNYMERVGIARDLNRETVA